jgi:hypothetical protein
MEKGLGELERHCFIPGWTPPQRTDGCLETFGVLSDRYGPGL